MATILALSSRVASGHVGLSAIEPALHRLGHEVIGLPTILLSNHPGRQPASGTRIEPAVLEQMLATLDTNGRLDHVDAVLTGYLPSAAHVEVAVQAIERCRGKSPQTVVLCDPVIGDDSKGLYIAADAAAAIRSQLVPLADILTPNRFELAWLTGRRVEGPDDAVAAALHLARPLLVATSIPHVNQQLTTMAVTPAATYSAAVARRAFAPNGTGDLLSALFLAGLLATPEDLRTALEAAVLAVDVILATTGESAELNLLQPTPDWWSSIGRRR